MIAIEVCRTAALGGHLDKGSIGGSVTGGTALAAGGTLMKLIVPLSNPFLAHPTDTFQSRNLYEFDEDQNILLAAPLTVDVGSRPIPARTIVASHYVFFDPVRANTLLERSISIPSSSEPSRVQTTSRLVISLRTPALTI
jgi:hypothetical protein